MPLPIMTDKDDIDNIVNLLKRKFMGITIEEAKATIPPKLIDPRKLNGYRTWGFIGDNGNKLILTELGTEYGQATEEGKQKIFGKVINNIPIYKSTVEWLSNRKVDQVEVSDIAAHWHKNFTETIGTNNEISLNNQVIGFMNLASAAGLGDYKVGRKGQQTRLIINKAALEGFVDALHSDSVTSETISDTSPASKSTETVLNTNGHSSIASPPAVPAQPNPSLHIDIQIHISSDATPEQIDQIFASMSKHLYQNNRA